MHKHNFGQILKLQSAVVTVNIRSRSLQSNSLFFVSEQITCIYTKIVSEYDQELPQSQTADNPVAPRGRAAQQSQDTRKTN